MAAWVAPAILTAGSLLGGLFANKAQQQTTSSSLDPAYSPLQAALMQSIMARLGQPSALPATYAASQTGKINKTFNLAGQTLQNRMTASGLATSPVAGAGQAMLQTGRAGAIASMQNNLPLLERQLQTQDIQLGQGLMGTAPRTTTTTQPGNVAGGGLTSMMNMLAYLYGKGALGTQKTGAGGAAPDWLNANLYGGAGK
jgi:hypothetical protein